MDSDQDWLAEVVRDLERGGSYDNWPPAAVRTAVRNLVGAVKRLRSAEEVLGTILTQTDACIEQGGMYRYDECVRDVFEICFDYFHPEHRR